MMQAMFRMLLVNLLAPQVACDEEDSCGWHESEVIDAVGSTAMPKGQLMSENNRWARRREGMCS